MDGVSSLDIKDGPLIFKHLCIDDGKLKWFGNFKDLKSFLGSLVGLSGNGHRQEATLKFVYVELNPITNLVLLRTLRGNSRWCFSETLRIQK